MSQRSTSASAAKSSATDTVSLRDVIVEELSEQIISGEMAGGTRLHERNLSAAFGVSRVPVREAIFILESRGLVVSRPRIGAFVKPMTRKDADDLFNVLAALEPLAASLAAVNRTGKDIEIMRECLADAERAAAVGDAIGGSRANMRFHLALIDAGNNDLLISILSPTRPRIQRLFRHTMVDIADDLCQSHNEIFVAVKSRDAKRASDLAREHAAETRAHGTSLFE